LDGELGFRNRRICASNGAGRRWRGFSRARARSRPTPLPGVASMGTRTHVARVITLLEAHLFDFSGDLYGREIEVSSWRRLRDEEFFRRLEALIEKIRRDRPAEARAFGRLIKVHG